jgi:uncharacterized alpha-E superfamily protein
MHFCVIHAQESLREICGSIEGTYQFRSEQLLGRVRADLDYTHVQDVIEQGTHEFIDQFQQRLNEIGSWIHSDFFTKPALVDHESLEYCDVAK